MRTPNSLVVTCWESVKGVVTKGVPENSLDFYGHFMFIFFRGISGVFPGYFRGISGVFPGVSTIPVKYR